MPFVFVMLSSEAFSANWYRYLEAWHSDQEVVDFVQLLRDPIQATPVEVQATIL